MSTTATTTQAATTGATTAPASAPANTSDGPPTVAARPSEPKENVQHSNKAKTQKNFQARAPIAASNGPTKQGLSMMLSGVADLSLYSVKHMEPTFKVPSLIQFFYVLSVMDTQMVHTKRFTDANTDWHPYVSRLYFTVLIFYQVLKNQKVAAAISQEQSLFLEFLESQYQLSHAKIPGPLVIFFQSLAANAGPNENYGNLTFAIPTNLDVTQDNEFRFARRINTILPNPIFILDQLMNLINDLAPLNALPQVPNMASTDHVFTTIYGTAAANNAANRFCMMNPLGRFEPQVTTSLLATFLNTAGIWRTCLPFDPATHASTYTTGNDQSPLSFAQVLGFQGFGTTAALSYNWFNQVGRIMQPYSDFFKDSTSLGSVSTVGLGIGYLITQPLNHGPTADTLCHDVVTRTRQYQNVANNVRYAIAPFDNVFTHHLHSEEHLDLVTEQAGVITQLDVDWTQVNGNPHSVCLGPARQHISIGPIENRPIERQSPAFLVPNTVSNLISGYYHVPTAMKFE